MRSEGEDVVENPAESNIQLIDHVSGKDVSFRNGCIPAVIDDELVATKGVGFSPSRGTTRHKVGRMIVAKAGKSRVFAGKVVVEADVKRAFVKFPHRLIDVVETRRRSG